ncbi:acyl-CoA N-acyltransferase [Coniella lustricola]|uniref:Acyl-CoA N-acyltransferase n=1 Tax=Coniella lustricola TaxID=2025994 RepID=A0A2T3AG24_9PEZI|nr:acyl-CoA N-acyltransferase [Coniella lustricola]
MATSAFKIREACKADIPALIQISINANRGRPLINALFPPHLKAGPGDPEESFFQESWYETGLQRENQHYPVVVNDKDEVLGYACWQSAPGPLEPEKTREERKAECPPTMDFDVWEFLRNAIKALQEHVKAVLGEDEFKRAWYLDVLAVDPAHQRKGIARMLMQWGEERAAREHKSIHLVSSPTGAKLYRALGYEQVGEMDLVGQPEAVFIKRPAQES